MAIFTPGILLSILTFPGIIMHEFAHKIFCNITGVRVFKVKYFRFGNPPGYVKHAMPTKFSQTFLITVAPFIVNTLAALLMFFIFPYFEQSLLLVWLGFSFAMNSFPSKGDAKSLWRISKHIWRKNLSALLGFPVAAFIYIANLLRIIWFDAIYAIALFYIAGGFEYLPFF